MRLLNCAVSSALAARDSEERIWHLPFGSGEWRCFPQDHTSQGGAPEWKDVEGRAGSVLHVDHAPGREPAGLGGLWGLGSNASGTAAQ